MYNIVIVVTTIADIIAELFIFREGEGKMVYGVYKYREKVE